MSVFHKASLLGGLVFTMAGSALAQGPTGAPAENLRYIDGIIANVAGRIILYSDLAGRLEQARQSGVPVTDSLACGQLEDLLYQQLLLEQAKIDSVTANESQVSAELDRRISYFEQQIGGREKLEKFYGKSVTEIKADFHDQIADQLLGQQMQQKITGDLRATPKQVEEFFDAIPKDSLPFINAGVEFSRITVMAKPTEEEDRRVKLKLEGYRDAIVKGEKDFCTVAILYSQDPGSAAQCGELGMVPLGVMVPEFDAVAMSLKDGEISPVFRTKYGYHIMEMIERKGEQYNARHILLIPKASPADVQAAKDRLDSLMTLVRDGKLDFRTVATEYNDDEDTKGTNGVVMEPNSNSPHWAIGDLDQKTFLVLDKLAVGQISEPQAFENPDGSQGYRVFRLQKHTAPHRMNLAQDYPLVQQATEAKLRQQSVDTWVKERLGSTYVNIIPAYRGCKFEHPWVKAQDGKQE
jgi:peptidyl-prolyl cis-trans isomerase SurA